jgi:N6-adenosine-specific RNA methylase IME4
MAITKHIDLKQKLDEIDSQIYDYAYAGLYNSKFKILVGMWDKGNAIISFLGGIETKPNYLELERETGRGDDALKKWRELVIRYPKREDYIENEAKPKAESWVQKLLTPKEIKELGTPELPSGVFNVIYCDPPWEYENSGFEMSAENHYPVMSIDELCQMDIKSISAENSVCFMWVTNPILEDGQRLLKAWGFDYKTNFVWVKKNHTAGFYVFGKHEILMIGIKGSMLPSGEKFKSVIEGENLIHSKKPEIVYEMIEKMYPGCKYIELFARNTRKGWEPWGNEI